ncbi:MAG: ATP-binding protein [Deltaproteobacteria bacterium]|nr:ATP-binding protein [Deltaproteobacteria bacterium]
MSNALKLGAKRPVDGKQDLGAYVLDPDHLTTHGVIVGMTGSGKTGLVMVLVEEALANEIPVLVIDVKGDLPNLLLAVPSFDPEPLAPWVEAPRGDEDGIADPPLVAEVAAKRASSLRSWGIDEDAPRDFGEKHHIRIVTPGSDAGEQLHLLSALERRSPRWDDDLEGARSTLGAAISLVMRLVGRDAEPGKSREHALLSVLAEKRLIAGKDASLGALVPEILEPPFVTIGALEVDEFLSPRARKELAADLNTLLAAPSLAGWRTGASLDVAAWMAPVEGKTPATVVSVAHLDEDECQMVLGVILEEVLTWVRTLPGTSQLRALVVFDEMYGFVPPHPASPPTKRPIVSLMKQARAYGVGVVLATQNPMDLDYRALSNAGLWMLGRLQTDADRERVLEGLGETGKKSPLGNVLKKLPPRWFVVRNSHDKGPPMLLQPRYAISYLRGPMTREEIRKARLPRDAAFETTVEENQ